MISIAICNAKGGVAKTTTALNMASFLAHKNKKVLLMDLDPQGNASKTLLNLQLGKIADKPTMYDVFYNYLMENKKNIISETIKPISENENLFILPATLKMEQFKDLIKAHSREPIQILKDITKKVSKDYDYLIIDCPADLSIYVENAIKMADYVLCPSIYDYYGIDALALIIPIILEIKGSKYNDYKVLYTLFNSRATQIQKELEKYALQLEKMDKVFPFKIPVDQKVRNWQAKRIDFMTHKDFQKSKAKIAYEELGNYVLSNWK